MQSPHVHVAINLQIIRAHVEAIKRRVGPSVRVMPMIKSDAYGLGARQVAAALADVVEDFSYFSLAEARDVGRPGLVTGPPLEDPAEFRALRARPAISTLEEARRYAGMPVALHVDVGMQRFGFPPEQLDDFIRISGRGEAFGHAATAAQAKLLEQTVRGRIDFYHSACSSLLDEPAAWQHAVRPGVAIYRGAARVTTRLSLVRETRGPVGYTGFEYGRLGVILVGYSQFLRPAPVLINGRRQRTLEIGMNTAFVTVHPDDRAGDEVVLLGDGITEAELAPLLDCREHEIITRYAGMGPRSYCGTS